MAPPHGYRQPSVSGSIWSSPGAYGRIRIRTIRIRIIRKIRIIILRIIRIRIRIIIIIIWSEGQGYMGTKVQVDRNLEERTWFQH
jgi:hypothetical protein